jgi:predicted dehydrogenase
MISSWFVEDLVLDRPDAKAKHIVQSIGSSSIPKGQDFVAKYCPKSSPAIYGTYDEVYADPDVDCVYIGTPHSFHKKNCLDAIAAGKNVLCEKAFTINAREAREVLDAAHDKGVYVHEAMWLRHRPLVAKLRKLIFEDNIIGDVFRMSSDFSLFVDIANLPPTSRYKDLNLGAGTLLDIGIYPLTWALITLDPKCPSQPEQPKILAQQTLDKDGIEIASNIILQYPSTGRQAIVTSTTMADPINSEQACRIQGTDGYIEVHGDGPSVPTSFTVHKTKNGSVAESKKYDYPRTGRGFIHEADNTAVDIAEGRKESAIMPWKETLRVMEIMDEIRRQGGAKYPQDEQ